MTRRDSPPSPTAPVNTENSVPRPGIIPARYQGDYIAWSGGCLFIGSGGGPVAPHSHYAIQLVIGAPSGLQVQSGHRGSLVDCHGALVPSRAVHSIDVSSCDWSAVLFIEPETQEGRALSARMGGQIEFLEKEALAGMDSALEQAWRRTRTADAVQYAAQALVSSLSRTIPHVPSDPRVLAAIEHLRAQDGNTLALEDVAAVVHLSPSRFRHVFVEETGMPLRTYQLWRRLLKAWEILMRGDNLANAAHAAGFADSAHLSRTCRTMFGLAPSAMQMKGPLSERLRAPSS
ncbi:AraC family transcriptional regulator [Cupriavidus pinatubonensis]|nr:AraC family transcriptional regulator [Cupriavidus pinatubonensis]